MKHDYKLPWAVDRHNSPADRAILNKDKRFVLDFSLDLDDHLIKNSDYIVHCVNMHDELVQILIEVEQMIHAGELNEGTMSLVRNAISKAVG